MMRRGGTLLLLGLSLLAGTAARAQTAADAAADGRAFGNQVQGNATSLPTDQGTAQTNVPGYQGGQAPQTQYMSNPAAMDSDKFVVAQTNDGYQTLSNSDQLRPKIDPQYVQDTVAWGKAINQNAGAYATGVGAGGTQGQCVPLPPSPGSAGTYERTCNVGLKPSSGPQSCVVPIVPQFTTSHSYTCTKVHQFGGICYQGIVGKCTEPDVQDDVLGSGCDDFPPPTCSLTETSSVMISPGNRRTKAPTYYETYAVTCQQAAGTGVTGTTPNAATYPLLSIDNGVTYTYSGSIKDESACASVAADTACSNPQDVCTDSDPTTRVVNGVSVTQPCWAWTRTFQCNRTVQANDCGEVEAIPGCALERTDCLDDPAPTDGSCKVQEKVYVCPIPGGAPVEKQFLCGGDVFCAGNVCQPVPHDQSPDFANALVALHTLGEASKGLDQNDLTLFKGAGNTCSKPVFGLGNCCGGHGIPLIGQCNDSDRKLEKAIDNGYAHYVGSFCSASFLGICTSKALSYCVFGSKLTRILQEQGRPQINKGWGPAKRPDCSGFAVAQFASLDLSKMNFSEIYADFVNAAKLPDQQATLTDIQGRIQAFYAQSGGH